MENIQLENLNTQKLKLRAGEYVAKDVIVNLKGTKAIMLEDMLNTDLEYNQIRNCNVFNNTYSIPVTTWSNLVREAIKTLQPQIERVKYLTNLSFGEIKILFDTNLRKICETTNIKLNTNCPKRLFRDSETKDLIHSSVYLNNKNHFIPVLTDEDGTAWGFCAVYTGEIIVMLEALLDTIYEATKQCSRNENGFIDFKSHTMVITYINREDLVSSNNEELINEVVDEVNEELNKLEMSKDVIKLQGKVAKMHSLVMEIYSDIETIQNNYGLMSLDDIMKK